MVALGLVVIPAMRFLMDANKQNRDFQGRLLLRSLNHGQLKAVSSYALISLNWLEKMAHPIICFFQKCVLGAYPCTEGAVTGFSLEVVTLGHIRGSCSVPFQCPFANVRDFINSFPS